MGFVLEFVVILNNFTHDNCRSSNSLAGKGAGQIATVKSDYSGTVLGHLSVQKGQKCEVNKFQSYTYLQVFITRIQYLTNKYAITLLINLDHGENERWMVCSKC